MKKNNQESLYFGGLSHVPLFVGVLFRGMPDVWIDRHLLYLYWMVRLQAQAIVPGRKTIKELSRWSPAHITEWRLQRFLKAGYWTVQQLITWWAKETITCFPAHEKLC